MSEDMEILWPKSSMIHPNFLNYVKVSRISEKRDDYITRIGVRTDRELQIYDLRVFCGNLTEEMAGDLADGVRTVKWVEEGENYIVSFPYKDATCGIHVK
jgi:hypothetical protein